MLLYWFAAGVAPELADAVLEERCTPFEAHDADDGGVIGFVDVAGRVSDALVRDRQFGTVGSRTVSDRRDRQLYEVAYIAE
jgi:hypothetical protein